jgi:hypothetical protein
MFYLEFFTRSMKAGKRLRVKNGLSRRTKPRMRRLRFCPRLATLNSVAPVILGDAAGSD